MTRPLPRVELTELPTPLESMPRLAEWLGLDHLLVKRDDLTGLALGGNKARKLELLCAEAIARGCDVLVTGGGAQSNHARMTAAAASHLGLGCDLAIGAHQPDDLAELGGNLLLDHLLGATLHFTGRDDYYAIEESIEEVATRVRALGRTPFVIPVGGASLTGAAAYVYAGDELRHQLEDRRVDWIFVADGSGGTHAGLLAALGPVTRVVGVDVGTRPDLDTAVPCLAALAAEALGRSASDDAEVIVDHGHFGDGYALPSEAGLEAMRATARREGIVLDPVYTGKAMAALFTWARDRRIARGDTVVLWHTGGAVALFAREFASTIAAL